MPATAASLLARHQAITAQYHEHESTVQDVQEQAVQDLLPLLKEELEWDDETTARARTFLQDQVTVFRFCRRGRFSPSASLKLLHATLSFRFSSSSPTSLSTLSTSTVSPLYLNTPLFFFHPSLRDKFGRPCAVLNLREVRRTEDGELGQLKDFVRLGWEMGRRWLSDLSGEGGVKLQIVLIVDLEGAGMSNLEVELLPFFMDLLKSHFPGMVGAIFVLNYGWMYAGMWQLAKRVLPNTALERILFPSKDELLEFFEEDCLLKEHGGTLSYTYTPSNPILATYAQPLTLIPSSPTSSSPTPFHSAPSTRPPTPTADAAPFPLPLPTTTTRPSSLTRRPSGLSMTTLKQAVETPVGRGSGLGFSFGAVWGGKGNAEAGAGGAGLRRVTSFAELQERLAETQLAIQSDDEEEDLGVELDVDGAPAEGEAQVEEPDSYVVEADEDGESSRAPSTAATSARSSRATSRNVSRATSREGSPAASLRRREREEAGLSSSRAQRFSRLHHLSPYNHSNPYYGYPAFIPSSSSSTLTTTLDPNTGLAIPRPHYHRRRKRDLVRTLTYLAVLRFLALHRGVRAKLGEGLGGLLRVLHVGGGGGAGKVEAEGKRKVHWEVEEGKGKGKATATSSSSSAGRQHLTLDQSLTLVLLFILLRTPNLPSKSRTALSFILFRLPVKLLGAIVDALVNLVARVTRRNLERVRKRDVLRRAVGEGGRRLVLWAERGKS